VVDTTGSARAVPLGRELLIWKGNPIACMEPVLNSSRLHTLPPTDAKGA
jgi:hypothetical protein